MDVFLQTKNYLEAIEASYKRWLGGNTPLRNHECTSHCNFVQFDAKYQDALGCEQSGQLHLCGDDCDRTVRSGRSTETCELTGRLVRTISQTGSYTVAQNVQNLHSAIRNNKLKRKREVLLKEKPKRAPPDASKLLIRKKAAKTRKRGKGRKPKSKTTRNVRLYTTNKERHDISHAIQLFMFHRDHLANKRVDDALSSSKTSVNNFLRSHVPERRPVRFPFMVSAACNGIPLLEGRKPIQTTKRQEFVRNFCAFLTNYTAKAFTHFKMVKNRIQRYRITPSSKMPSVIVQSNFENAASNIDHIQFAISFLLHCCKGKRSKYDNRELIPTISFLTIFAPRESDLQFIFDGEAHKTCLKLNLFMDFADQLYSLKLIKMDPSLSPQRLFMQSQNTVGYDSKQMMLVAATLTQPKPQMAQAPRKRLPTPSKLILVPSLTTEFATFLSQKGTTGRIKTDYWCLLLQTGDDVELTVATSNEVQERKQQALVCIGRWSSKERAEETLQQWDIDSDAAANGIQLGKRLRLGDQPDIKIYASSHVLEK